MQYYLDLPDINLIHAGESTLPENNFLWLDFFLEEGQEEEEKERTGKEAGRIKAKGGGTKLHEGDGREEKEEGGGLDGKKRNRPPAPPSDGKANVRPVAKMFPGPSLPQTGIEVTAFMHENQ